MLSIFDQRLRDKRTGRGRGQDQCDPCIVNPTFGDRQDAIAERRSKRHRRTGDAVPSQQALEPAAAAESPLLRFAESNRLPQSMPQRLKLLVHEFGITERKRGLRLIDECGRKHLQFVRPPHVVLVGQDDDLAGACGDGVPKGRG